ncbi:MAG: tetratricopeptide repeat protein [Bacteroidetes bacterium]|nr:tetratricopeptide repeat protein [Bacteroidota bacterium]
MRLWLVMIKLLPLMQMLRSHITTRALFILFIKNPQYAEAFYNRGLSYEYLRKNKEALADYNQALAINPTFDLAARGKSKVLGEN